MSKTNDTIYKAEEVAKYFIFLSSRLIGEEREGVTNLKLQKILYFAQAYFVAKLNRTLFSDPIEAWNYGPVVGTIYHKYKENKNQPIILEMDDANISESDKVMLSKIWDLFGGYSASRLVDMTHEHKPWKTAFNGKLKEISIESLRDYYSPMLNK